MIDDHGSPEKPKYRKQLQNPRLPTKLFMIIVEEGWRSSILCEDMYEWAADWLINIIQGMPYAPRE